MKYEYKKEDIISYSECDKKIRLGLVNIFNLAEDVSTEYYGTFKSDNITLRKENNAAWVYTKISIFINKIPKWGEKILCRGYTIVHTKIKTRVEIDITDSKGNMLITIVQESCPIDLDTRKIRKLETVSYPQDMENQETAIEKPFLRLTSQFEEKDYVYSQTVKACDIDYTNHTNNVMYIKYILNSFNSDFWNNKEIENFEVFYLKESKEGNKLKIYRKQIDKNTIEFLIKNEETNVEVIKALLKYHEI